MLRGGSWNNNTPQNLLSSNRNNNDPENRNDNNGFRLVLVVGALPRRQTDGEMPGGSELSGQCQEASLTAVPAPRVSARGENTRRRAVAGNGCHPGSVRESHGPLFLVAEAVPEGSGSSGL